MPYVGRLFNPYESGHLRSVMSHSMHSSPQHPQSTIWRVSGPSRQEVSSGSSYRPSKGIPAATSLIPSSRHTDLRQHLDSRRSGRDEQASREVTPQWARWSLKFSSSAKSRVDNSERIIAELCREISDLRKEARGKSPAKERPRKGLIHYNQEDPASSLSVHTSVWVETPSPSEEIPCLASWSELVWVGREELKRSDKSINGHRDTSVYPWEYQRKKARRGEQGAIWKALDLVFSLPFTEEIERAELPEKFTAPRFEVYNNRTNPVAYIGHY